MEQGLSRRNEALISFVILLANLTTDILICVDYYSKWSKNRYDETNLFSILIIGAILLTNLFQLITTFISYAHITSQLLEKVNSKCHFLFLFFYSLGSMIGLSQPLFLWIIWPLHEMKKNINWFIFRELNASQAIYQSSIGGTLQIYLLISENQYENTLAIISIIISVLSYSFNITMTYIPIQSIDSTTMDRQFNYNSMSKIKIGPMPALTYIYFYTAIVTDYLLRSVILCLSIWILRNNFKDGEDALYDVLLAFLILPHLIIYVLYVFKVKAEYQYKYTTDALKAYFDFYGIQNSSSSEIKMSYILKGTVRSISNKV